MKKALVAVAIIAIVAIVAAWYAGLLNFGGSQVPPVTSASQAGKMTTDISSTINQIGSSLTALQNQLG